jgi:hypothetical protein
MANQGYDRNCESRLKKGNSSSNATCCLPKIMPINRIRTCKNKYIREEKKRLEAIGTVRQFLSNFPAKLCLTKLLDAVH